MVFQAPHSGHLPIQRGLSAPQAEHTKLLLFFAIFHLLPIFGFQSFFFSAKPL